MLDPTRHRAERAVDPCPLDLEPRRPRLVVVDDPNIRRVRVTQHREPIDRTGRSTPSPTARRQHPQHVARRHPDRALVRQPLRPRLVAARQQPVLAHRARLAAGESPRLRHPPLGDQRHGHVLEHQQVALDALAARREPGAAAAPPQPVAQHPHRERPLQRLDRRVLACSSSRCGRRSCPCTGRAGRPVRRRPSRSTPSSSRTADEDVVHRPLRCGPDSMRDRPARARRGRRRRRAGSPRRCRRRPRREVAPRRSCPPASTTRTGRSAPPFAGMVGSVTDRNANDDRDVVTASTALTLPGRCGSVPVKSNVIVVAVDRDATPRSSPARCSGAARSSRVRRSNCPRAVGQSRERGAHPPLAIRRRPRRTARLARDRRRGAEHRRALAPTCASRSPARSIGRARVREQHRRAPRR